VNVISGIGHVIVLLSSDCEKAALWLMPYFFLQTQNNLNYEKNIVFCRRGYVGARARGLLRE
jgi:hypothetical protein